MSYTKLFASIVNSTIWTEDDKTRIVWITMLALADKHGEISASVPGLARAAGVEVPDCEAALEKFLSPDKYSRTKDDEGRRIEVIDGGWSLLNHGKYRAMASKDEAKAKNAARQQKFRDRERRNASVTDSNAHVADSNANVTQDRDIAEAEAENTPQPPKGGFVIGIEKLPKPSERSLDQTQLRLNALFNRKPTTKWSEKMLKGFQSIEFEEDDLATVEAHYAFDGEMPDKFQTRSSLETLLNNWQKDVDKARSWLKQSKANAPTGRKLSNDGGY